MPRPDKEVIFKIRKFSLIGIAKAKDRAENSVKWVFGFFFLSAYSLK